MTKLLAFILLQIGTFNQIIEKEVSTFQNSQAAKNGIVSISIKSTKTDKIIYEHQAHTSVNSASILKLVSTGSILTELGPDFRFETKINYSGEIIENTLNGDLIIISEGDPSFGSPRYKDQNKVIDLIINRLKSLGINKINGSLKIPDSDFFIYDHPDSWIWGDMGNYYGAVPHQFNYHENYYTVAFNAPYKEGAATTIASVEPQHKDWTFINTVTAGPSGSGDQVYIYSAPSVKHILLKGTVPRGSKEFKVKGSIMHPAAVFREKLLEGLDNAGISVEDKRETRQNFLMNNEHNTPLLILKSPSLQNLVQDCNHKSINLYADAFTAKLAAVYGKGYLLTEGSNMLKEYWSNKGLKLDGFELKDGSGLSPSGLVTSDGMTEILNAMYKSPYFEQYLETIPVVGRSGTVRYLDRAGVSQGRIHAKSGSIQGTRSYAGYVKAKNDNIYSFSIIVNRYAPNYSKEVRSFLEKILVSLIDIDQF